MIRSIKKNSRLKATNLLPPRSPGGGDHPFGVPPPGASSITIIIIICATRFIITITIIIVIIIIFAARCGLAEEFRHFKIRSICDRGCNSRTKGKLKAVLESWNWFCWFTVLVKVETRRGSRADIPTFGVLGDDIDPRSPRTPSRQRLMMTKGKRNWHW